MTPRACRASIRHATTLDFAAVVALNQADLPRLSDLNVATLERYAAGWYFRIAELDGRVVGFVVAMTDACAHDSVHFRWFKSRFARFVYVDRIVVADDARRSGIGAALYRSVDGYATESGIPCITCEVNLRPRNPESLAFHDHHGFVEVGTEDSEDRTKTVSLRIKHLGQI